uniref:Uncharacterized protein n=1 Tax=Zea mays TaxID=4577 RepID=B7ZZI4_MAIZE|nr:unknown [Zea mays]
MVWWTKEYEKKIIDPQTEICCFCILSWSPNDPS